MRIGILRAGFLVLIIGLAAYGFLFFVGNDPADWQNAIKAALFDYKHRIRDGYRFYSQDLINNLFTHPYTKIEFVQRDLSVSRLTATKYLEALTAGGFVRKQKIGRGNYYINLALNAVLQSRPQAADQSVQPQSAT